MMHQMRYHVNSLSPGAAVDVPRALADVRSAVVGAVTAAASSSSSSSSSNAASSIHATGPTVYTGAAGIAYALARAARSAESDAGGMMDLARRVAAEAAAARGLARRPLESVMDGQAGVAAVEALVALAADPSAPLDGPLTRFAAAAARAAAPPQRGGCQSDEVLYGRAGTLLGALALRDAVRRAEGQAQGRQSATTTAAAAAAAFGDPVLTTIAARILESGRATARVCALAAGGPRHTAAAAAAGARAPPPPPLWFTWPEPGGGGDPYLGAAHGLAGIAHALLHVWDLLPSVDGRAREDVAAALDYILAHEADAPGRAARGGHFPVMCGGDGDGRRAGSELVHFCHGAPGIAMVLAKAWQTTGHRRYLDAALRAGGLVWERGLLKKGPSLCHGVAGNAYALLALWRATGEPSWREKAEAFACFIASPEGRADWRTPDRPLSLFEGLAGALVLLEDLNADAAAARFPFFEV